MTTSTPWDFLAQAMDEMSPRLRFEVRRKSIHVLGAIAAGIAFLVIPFAWAIGMAIFIILVIAAAHFVRRYRIKVASPLDMLTEPIGDALDRTRRPHEDFPWAPVTFTVALILIGSATVALDVDKAYALAAFGILGLGDAASALIGVAYGRHKLPWNRGKSWEGSAAGLVGSFFSAIVLAALDFSVRRAVFPVEWLLVALAGAVVGTLIETLPKVQDNLFVPLGALAAMLVAASALGML